MQRLLRQPFFLLLLATAALALFATVGVAAEAEGGRTPTIVDLDLAHSSTTVIGPDRDVAVAPGSTLKPLVLLTALRLHAITPETRVACTGTLRVANRNLACAHPAALGVLDAQEGLAYSCNRYFAAVALHMSAAALQDGLQRYRIEALQPLRTPEDRILFALGLQDVTVTPMRLAHAYAEFAQDPILASPVGDPVRQGLLSSVTYGMSRAARTQGLVLGGKTGTAHDDGPMLQHGWFAGIVFANDGSSRPLHVIVVYAPGGNGNDAAVAAHNYLQQRRW